MKEAALNVLLNPRIMGLCLMVSQVIALATTLAGS